MKKLLLLIIILGTGLLAHAQDANSPSFSIGPEMALPQNSVYSFGYGASAKIEIPVIKQFSLSLTGGYTTMDYKSAIVSTFGSQPPSHFIPLKAGIRYGAGGFFLEAEGGNVIETTGNKANLFAFSVGPGFRFTLSPKQSIEVGVRYEKWAKNVLTQTGVRVAYRIRW